MVAKVAGGIIGLGLIGTGSVAMAKPEWFGINKEVPWTPLSQDKDYSDSAANSPYKDKFGSEYKNYLTGVKGKENKSNDVWWEESLKKLKQDKAANSDLGNGFKETIDKAVRPSGESGNDKYLNEICDTVYKSKDKVKPTPGSSSSDEYKEAEVWKYCSPLGQKPTIVKGNSVGVTYSDNNIGKKKEDKLVSVADPKNDKFWEIRDKEFKNKEGYGPIETGSTKDDFFKTDLGKTIKQLCEEAYKQDPANGGSSTAKAPTEDQAVKYCSLDKK